MIRFLIVIIALAFVIPVQAQTGNCEASLAQAEMNVNNVRARIFNNGGLFWRGGGPMYEVPKYENVHAIFAAGIWVGGMIGGELRVAASRYGQWEMWAGPLDEAGNPPEDCAPFDHIYNIYQRDLIEYDRTGIASDDLVNWPWELGAPVVDGDGNPDNYNVPGGDRPEIIGHQTQWWIMNDRGNVHESTETDPIGLEIHVTAFAAASTNEHVNNATLYRYKLINRGSSPLKKAYIGLFQDVDLGNFDDDYVGSDTTLSLGYTYNADNLDEGGYGEAPPAIGFDFISGVLVDDGIDNDGNGIADETGERLSMTTFAYYNGGGSITGDPGIGRDYYNYLSGRWRDEKPFTVGGTGRDFSDIPTSFIFPGDPVTGTGWTELTPDPFGNTLPPIDPGDRRSIIGSGPFILQPDQALEIVISVLWARGEDNLDSITRLREASVVVQEAYESGFDIQLPAIEALSSVHLVAPANHISAQPTDLVLQWQQIPNTETYHVEWSTDPAFNERGKQIALTSTSLRLDDLEPDTDYFWRVRGANASELGPWSETRIFSTSNTKVGTSFVKFAGFMTTQNAAGPIDPPDMAAFAFNDNGFPILEGKFTPEGSYPDPFQPTSGVQQSTNSATWGIHALTDVSVFDDKQRSSFVREITSYHSSDLAIGTDSYEWRFTAHCRERLSGRSIQPGDCLSRMGYDKERFTKVPFELWNIGSLPDASDDFRMIPMMDYEFYDDDHNPLEGFRIGEDHTVSDDLDDPRTSSISWYKPADNGATAGEQGYNDYFFGDAETGDLVFWRMVLVQLDGGEGPFYRNLLPEPGTIFRIITEPIQAPILSAPTNRSFNTSPNTALYWSATPASYRLQIDISPDFTSPMVDTLLEEPFYTNENLPDDATYFWRVRILAADSLERGAWSDTWQFTIPRDIENAPVPLNFSLEHTYPNPFSTTTYIRYALPKPSNVKLEVFDTLGRRVHTLQNQEQPAGRHEIPFDATTLSNGVYFYRLEADNFTDTKSMTVSR